jgi:hypothetical protein
MNELGTDLVGWQAATRKIAKHSINPSFGKNSQDEGGVGR